MISLRKGVNHWTTHLGLSFEKPVQIVGPKRIGQLLRPREIVDANKSIVSHCITKALNSKTKSWRLSLPFLVPACPA